MAFWGDIGRVGVGIATGGLSELAPGGAVGGPLQEALDRSKRAEELYGGVDPSGRLGNAAGQASGFGRQAASNYQQAGQQLGRQQDAMRGLSRQFGQLSNQYGQQFGGIAGRYGRIAQGQDSISAEQLRQGLQQNHAAQMSMAAGARPQDASMAALGAARNMGDAAAGMSGQAAMAGLQERRDALGAQLGALGAGANAQQGFMGGQAGLQGAIQQGMLTGRGQDVQATLGGQQGALQGYGGIEQARTNRYGALMGQPTYGEHLLSGAQGAAQMFAASDKRLKTDIEDADDDAERLLKGLRAYRFRYKDSKHGEGSQLGVMAQDLERAGAGHAVVDTPGGKMVHGAKLATALAAAAGNLDRRLRKVEGKGK